MCVCVSVRAWSVWCKVIAIELEVSLYCLTHSPPSVYIQTTLVVPKKKIVKNQLFLQKSCKIHQTIEN